MLYFITNRRKINFNSKAFRIIYDKKLPSSLFLPRHKLDSPPIAYSIIDSLDSVRQSAITIIIINEFV